MDSNFLDKTLNFVLKTLPRTLTPLEAIRIWKKKSLNKVLKKTVKLQKSRSVSYDFTKKNLGGQFLKRKIIWRRMNENSENWQCVLRRNSTYRKHA